MGFRLRFLRLGLFTVLLVAMTAIPGAWYSQAPGTAFGPSISWAGGTPDETLHPQNPGKRTYTPSRGRYDTTRPGVALNARSDHGATATQRDRLLALLTFIRAMRM